MEQKLPEVRINLKEVGQGACSPTNEHWRGEGRALVVEDDPCVRNVIARTLRAIGFAVDTAEHGEQAWEIFSQNPSEFSFCLLDMTLPGKNGRETLADLRAAKPDLKAIIMSGYSKEDLASLQGICFLQKPMSMSTLRDAVRELLED